MKQKWAIFIDGAYGNGDGRGNGDSFDDDARRVPPVRPR